MNLPKETKIKRLIMFAMLVFSLTSVFPFQAHSDEASDKLNAEKTAKQKKLDQINKQIKDYTKQIADTRQKTSTLRNEVLIFDREIETAQLQIEAKNTQIDDTNLQIKELEKLIEQRIREIAENKKILAELIKQLNEFDNSYFLKTTLGSENLSEFLDQVQYTQDYQEKIYQLVQKIKDLKEKLENQKKDLELQLKNLQELKEQLEIAKSTLSNQRLQKQALLNQTRGLEKNYQKLLTSSQKAEAELQKEIEDLDAQIRAKLGNRSLLAGKGIIAWPMDGILTQKYGKTGFTALGYNFHNGIDIAAPAGQPIYAAADGTVKYVDSSDASYGNWVAIEHTVPTKSGDRKIITLYAHFKSYKVKPGQKVKQGDLIGYEGNTGNTTKKLYGPERGYHIHFGVYDAEGFGVQLGKYTNIYGNYYLPYGYTYNPLDFLQ